MSHRNSGRFLISCFPQPAQLDPHFAETTWQTLDHAINEINKRNTSNLSFEQLYRYSYNMVLHKHGEFLYNGLTRLQTQHLDTVADIIKRTEPPAFLAEIKRQWCWFEISLAHVRDVLMYMDRHYVKPNKKKTVYELGLSLFRTGVVGHPAILPRLSETLLASIDRERNGEAIDTFLVQNITQMLAELGVDDSANSVYANVFEDGFLERTRQFYAREATLYLSETTCSEYLRKASQRINEERLRVENYLQMLTAPKVRRVAETELISKYMDKLINMENSGLLWMLRNDKVDDLRLMYTLFKDVTDGEEIMRTYLKKEVLDRGTEIVQHPENIRDPIALINAILVLKDKYDNIVNSAFTIPISQESDLLPSLNSVGIPGGPGTNSITMNISAKHMNTAVQMGAANVDTSNASQSSKEAVPDKRFVSAVNESFERFINGFNRAAEYLSLYVDKLLRKDFKGCGDDEIEAKLDAVMALFRYLHERDVFERYYKQHLQKRLLYSRSTSSEAERSFITKMKTDCGYMYTSKMEVMFKDMKTSDDTTAQFRESVAKEGADMRGIDLRVFVLTTMSWPVTQGPNVILPEDAVHCTSNFEIFYYKKHDGRRLTWQQSLGTAELRATFGDRMYDLYSVSAYSMCILMLFNDHDSLTYKEISNATRIPDSELARHLQSLSLTKHKILRKEPREKDVKPDDKFIFNSDFQSRSRRIKIQVVTAQKENEAERNQTRCRINADRGPVIDTVIVRIMKHRKVLEHNQLIAEVTKELESKFEPNTQDIKKRIESLVEREYLERQKEKRQVYQYVA
ncbi:Cullin-3 [Gracilariopsis chorda]|uniref:Cullin-3 n=1 Tax=Gracilariopsis chorda TaxID=448386 RepID=A0A2V3J3R7_9FLOR|nr:Cullin-3 [Gracilariopsis chorda]|eukprot:PXF49024.1 Cullin-3 [Gracilariopsis chorda]